MSVELKGSVYRGFRRAALASDDLMKAFLEEESEILLQEVRRRTPVKSGRLKASMHKLRVRKTVLGWRSGVASDIPYASYVEYGTAPHIIAPNLKKSLHFYWPKGGARWVHYNWVIHPGTPAVYMFLKAKMPTEQRFRARSEVIFSRWKVKNRLTLEQNRPTRSLRLFG